MITDFMTLVWSLLSAALTAILSVWIPLWVESARNRHRSELFREWQSEYQGIDEPDGTWVSERVKVDMSRGKIRLKNRNSSQGYDYTAFGRLVHDAHIVGDWTSIKPGANAYGCFMLTITAQGDAMYGYWVGADQAGSRRYGRWILAQDDSAIETTKALLEQMRHSRVSKETSVGVSRATSS